MAKPKHYQHSIQKVSDLIPYVNNSRTHSDEQVTQIASSIKEFGFTSPVLIDEKGGIVAGHGRVMAAQKLKLDEVPCITLEGLTEAQKKAYVIADNQLPLNAGWDLDKLKLEIDGLVDLDFDINLLGFDDVFLDGLLDVVGGDSDSQEDGDSPYTDKIEGLTYESTGEIYAPSDTFDSTKVSELLSDIEKSSLNEDEKMFLRAAATRHYCFNYSHVAELYSTSDIEMQTLMEKSALVIVDYDKAVENGYAKLREVIGDDYKANR